MIRLSTNHLSGKSTLSSIISEDDEFDLLDVQPLKPKSGLVNLYGNQFSEIVAYYEQHGRLPTEGNTVSLDEKRLARRLKSIKENPDLCLQLRSIDFYNLLESNSSDYIHTNLAAESESPAYINKSELVTSLEDIFADDDDELLNFEEPDIFSMTHVSVDRKEQPDEIAQRQPCPDFQRFEPLFLQLRGGLKNGIFSLERFTHKLKISEGDFFVLNGVVGYVHSAGERLSEYSTYNARLHLIFENGTEMNMLYQSLTHGLVRDKEGRKVQLNGQKLIPSDVSVPSGLVYILATKSKDPALIPYKQNLYKIGFTETTVEQRIKNAEKDRTFLEAPVRIVATSQCFNLNAQKLEALVHGFLATRRLNITLKSHSGHVYTPKEWFHVPLATVQAVIQYIVDGTISQYRLDNTTGKIVLKH
ncbi:GIY-YIG nuclease family protein [Yersinia sp. 2105 StPb PI]|uniref:GIY-YIG nuclease family protein n=1 Tax=Yersinia sp. 2105 StPb PI TaxID=2507058 RepID=UPI000FFB26DE|nr:GIY-YIG nuclease family protein [Yersinia sp. 2105 StPb PI]RXA96404.1 GIY-YIG nuclease family protein [Yersinia sp. 2105 StPb PI]